MRWGAEEEGNEVESGGGREEKTSRGTESERTGRTEEGWKGPRKGGKDCRREAAERAGFRDGRSVLVVAPAPAAAAAAPAGGAHEEEEIGRHGGVEGGDGRA